MRILIIFLIAFSALFATPSKAQDIQRIAAVVNDDVISVHDLDTRLDLVIATSGLPDRADVRRRIAPQILRRLIDEQLQIQEASRLDLTVSDEDMERALQHIARQNKVPYEQFDGFLAKTGVDRAAILSQIKPEIAWTKVVGSRLRPQIHIGADEVDAALARLEANRGKPEYLLAEIFLRIDDPSQESEARQAAQRLLEQIRDGASFPALARSFSQSATGSEGGNLGWIFADNLPRELQQPVASAGPGQIVGPLRAPGGLYIIAVRDRRIAGGPTAAPQKVALEQLHLPLPADASPADVSRTMTKAESLRARATGCEAMKTIANELGTPLSGSLGTVALDNLPPAIAKAVSPLEVGETTAPLRAPDGVIVLMVCERSGGAVAAKTRDRVAEMLLMQRLETASRRSLRDLRRAAYIDIRI